MFRYKEVRNSISSSEFLPVTVQTRAIEDYAVQNSEPETYDLLLVLLQDCLTAPGARLQLAQVAGRRRVPGAGASAAGVL